MSTRKWRGLTTSINNAVTSFKGVTVDVNHLPLRHSIDSLSFFAAQSTLPNMFRDGFDYLYNDIFGPSRGYGYFGGGLGDSVDRRHFASVSQRALRDYENAESTFLKHLASVDTSKGPVTEEIVKFHLVPDMRKKFNKMVKEHGCTATHRKLTREEQDRINKNRRSLMNFSSVMVTPGAQQAYLQKHPELRSATSTAAATSTTQPSAPLQNTINKKRGADEATLTTSVSAKKAKVN